MCAGSGVAGADSLKQTLLSPEPDTGLKHITHKTMAWTETKSKMSNKLHYPGALNLWFS